MALSSTVDDVKFSRALRDFAAGNVPNEIAISYADGRIMSLATSFLTFAQIQLLADCIEPVLVLEVPDAAETLIQRGLLVTSQISADPLACHVLAVTEQGRSYVTAWVERQDRSQRQTGKALRRPIEFPVMGTS